MRSFLIIASLLGTALSAPFQATSLDTTREGFIKAHPGGTNNVEVTDNNLLNGTYAKNKTRVLTHRAEQATLPLKLVNNFSGGNVRAYISGLDSDGTVVFIGASGNL